MGSPSLCRWLRWCTSMVMGGQHQSPPPHPTSEQPTQQSRCRWTRRKAQTQKRPSALNRKRKLWLTRTLRDWTVVCSGFLRAWELDRGGELFLVFLPADQSISMVTDQLKRLRAVVRDSALRSTESVNCRMLSFLFLFVLLLLYFEFLLLVFTHHCLYCIW